MAGGASVAVDSRGALEAEALGGDLEMVVDAVAGRQADAYAGSVRQVLLATPEVESGFRRSDRAGLAVRRCHASKASLLAKRIRLTRAGRLRISGSTQMLPVPGPQGLIPRLGQDPLEVARAADRLPAGIARRPVSSDAPAPCPAGHSVAGPWQLRGGSQHRLRCRITAGSSTPDGPRKAMAHSTANRNGGHAANGAGRNGADRSCCRCERVRPIAGQRLGPLRNRPRF